MQDLEFKDALLGRFAEFFSAFSSPKRLEMIDLLAQGERNVESIAGATALSVANASRHLQVLKGAGLVTRRKDGLRVVYRLTDPDVVRGYRAFARLAQAHSAEIGRLVTDYLSDVDSLQPMASEELLERVGTGEVVVVDVRPEEEYAAGHVASARSIPLSDLEAHLAELPGDKRIVAYCRGPLCLLAAQAVRLMRSRGLEAVRLLDGYPEWRDAGLPVGTGAESFVSPRDVT